MSGWYLVLCQCSWLGSFFSPRTVKIDVKISLTRFSLSLQILDEGSLKVAAMHTAFCNRNVWFQQGLMSCCSFGEIAACPFLQFDFLLYLYHITKADRQRNIVKWTDESSLFLNIPSLTSVCKWSALICFSCSQVIPVLFFWLKKGILYG